MDLHYLLAGQVVIVLANGVVAVPAGGAMVLIAAARILEE